MEMQFTSSQLEVIGFPYKPASTLKVVAGPGSGKTITLLQKVHRLVQSQQVKPEEILILSLTNKAVDNIIDNLLVVFERSVGETQYTQEQLKNIVGQIHVNTVHGLANKVVIENEGLINIIEENGWRGLIKLISQDAWKGQSSKLMSTREFQKIFKEYKLGNRKENEVMERLITIMRNCQVFTNEDLIIRASEYLEKPTEQISCEEPCFTFDLKNKFKVVLIDEFQDLFPSLLPLLEKIVVNKQLILFGDPNQSIYDFLGDNETVIGRLDRVHTGSNFTIKHLYDNFRCTPEIMAVASNAMRHKMTPEDLENKNLVLKDFSGVQPISNYFDDPVDELEFIVDQICVLVCSGAKLSDIAILTKTNAQIQVIAEHLQLYGIGFQKLTAQPDWMSDSRVLFLIDLLRAIVLVHRESTNEANPSIARRSDFSVLVTLSSIKGVGNNAIQNFYRVCNEKNVSLWDYISQVPKNKWPSSVTNKQKIECYVNTLSCLVREHGISNINDPVELLKKLAEVACTLDFAPVVLKGQHEFCDFKSYLEEMLKVMKLCAQNRPGGIPLADWFLESYLEQGMTLYHHNLHLKSKGLGVVKLSTIHSSKGLEFPVVFLMGGISNFPISQTLLYVGMTRARNLLYLNNIRNSKVYPNSQVPDKPLVTNNYFWNYYNGDLKRPALHSPSTGNPKYELLQKQYGLRSLNRRAYTRWCYKYASQLCKFLG